MNKPAHSKKSHAIALSCGELVRARWWERGWERAIDVRAFRWTLLPEAVREKITSRWAVAAAREIVASGANVPPSPNKPDEERPAGRDS